MYLHSYEGNGSDIMKNREVKKEVKMEYF